MSADTAERLVYMASQIARNLALEPDPVAATADHIHAFWSGRMINQLLMRIDQQGGGEIEPVALVALQRLAQGRVPPPQSAATDPAEHGADAG